MGEDEDKHAGLILNFYFKDDILISQEQWLKIKPSQIKN